MNNKRYVYYDKYTGKILEILGKKKRGSAPYIEVDVEIVVPFLSGEKSMAHYVVAYNRERKKHQLLPKDDIIKLRNLGNKPYKIPYRKEGEFDLKITIYPASFVIEVTLDETRLSNLCSTELRDYVKFEKGTDIRIYIKDKDSESILKTIILDAQTLLEAGQLFFDTTDIDLNEVEFYTDRLFEKYYWTKGTAKYFSPSKERIQFNIHRVESKRKKGFEYHLEMSETDDGIKIVNKIEDLKVVKIYEPVDFYVVDKLDANILYDKFSLSPELLRSSKTILIPLNNSIKDKVILYNHKFISVLFERGDSCVKFPSQTTT